MFLFSVSKEKKNNIINKNIVTKKGYITVRSLNYSLMNLLYFLRKILNDMLWQVEVVYKYSREVCYFNCCSEESIIFSI